MPDAPRFSPTITLMSIARSYEVALGHSLKELGINTRQLGLLGHINATPPISFSELARRSGITVQSTHAAVDGLIRHKLVKDATGTPGAASSLQLTEAGEALLARAVSKVHTLDEDLSKALPQLATALEVSISKVTNKTFS